MSRIFAKGYWKCSHTTKHITKGDLIKATFLFPRLDSREVTGRFHLYCFTDVCCMALKRWPDLEQKSDQQQNSVPIQIISLDRHGRTREDSIDFKIFHQQYYLFLKLVYLCLYPVKWLNIGSCMHIAISCSKFRNHIVVAMLWSKF